MANVRFFISSDSITRRECVVITKGLFGWEPEREQIFFRHTPKSAFRFVGVEFTDVYALTDVCEEITVEVERRCAAAWEPYWMGTFVKTDCRFSVTDCYFQVTPKPIDDYKCLIDKWEIERSVYGAGAVVEVLPFIGQYELECCRVLDENPPDPETAPCGGFVIGTQWCLESFTLEGGEGGFIGITCFDRIIAFGTCDGGVPVPPQDGEDWNFLAGSCPTPRFWRCPNGDAAVTAPLSYGRYFSDVLSYLVEETGCGLTVQSHFFDIGTPAGTPPDNEAYQYAVDYLQKMTMHQKSDVKRPNSSNASLAKVWQIKLKDLLDDLRVLFNVYFKIDGTDLIVEHLSFFEGVAGLDFSTANILQDFEWDSETPIRERWIYFDELCSAFFYPGILDYECGSQKKEYRLKVFSCDLKWISDIDNADLIQDAGFVLLSNQEIGGDLIVNNGNRPLGFPALLASVHRFGRPFEDYEENGDAQTALSVRKLRKLQPFTQKVACDAGFDPSDIIATPLGNSEVALATENLYDCTINFQLNF